MKLIIFTAPRSYTVSREFRQKSKYCHNHFLSGQPCWDMFILTDIDGNFKECRRCAKDNDSDGWSYYA